MIGIFTIEALFELARPRSSQGVKLTKCQMILMFLMKLRHNFPDEDIGYRFGVHPSTVLRNSHKNFQVLIAQKYSWRGHLVFLARAQVWSNHKLHSTIKFLLGITPQGIIILCF